MTERLESLLIFVSRVVKTLSPSIQHKVFVLFLETSMNTEQALMNILEHSQIKARFLAQRPQE